MQAVGPVHPEVVTVIAIQRLGKHTATGDKLRFHATEREVESFILEPLQEQ